MATLLEALDEKEREGALSEIDWGTLFFNIRYALRFLFEHGSNRWSQTQLRDIAERVCGEYQKRVDPSRFDSDLPVEIQLAVQNYQAAMRLLDRENLGRSPYWLCGEARLRGVVLRGLRGPEAEIQFYQERIKQLREMGFRDWGCGSDLYGRAAKVAREAGSLQLALSFYQQGIKYFDEVDERQWKESRSWIIERKASLMFFLADLGEQLGDQQKAAATFQDVMELTAGTNLSLYDVGPDYNGGHMKDNIFKLAAERLRALKRH